MALPTRTVYKRLARRRFTFSTPLTSLLTRMMLSRLSQGFGVLVAFSLLAISASAQQPPQGWPPGPGAPPPGPGYGSSSPPPWAGQPGRPRFEELSKPVPPPDVHQ